MTDGTNLSKIRFDLVTGDDYMTALRSNIQKYMTVYSLKQIAEMSDVSYETLKSLVYSNTGDCKVGLVLKIAKALGISVDELLGASTIDTDAKESMCMLSEMPPQFLHYIRWSIRHNYSIVQKTPTHLYMNVMVPQWESNLIATHVIVPREFNISSEIISKSFLGVEIPCEELMPHFFKGDVLLLANDRKPRNNEYVVVKSGTSFWILLNDKGNYKTLTNGKINQNHEYLGYVCHIERSAE